MTARPSLHALCFCRRRADGLGFAPTERSKTLWFCDDCGPSVARGVYAMPQREFDRIEKDAVMEGGEKAGAFLDAIGKSDLAALSELEWRKLLEAVITGYSDSVRDQCAAYSVRLDK